MEVSCLGLSCFRLKGKEVSLITDPFPGKGPGPQAAIITLSHDHPRHNATQAVSGVRKVVKGPGEYEVAGVFILGIPSFHDAEKGKLRGGNTIYRIEMDGYSLCHLGDLGHPLSTAQVEELGTVDILFLPVGGVSTIDAAQAAETVSLLEPKVVIPMHYRTPTLGPELEPLAKFLGEMGLGEVTPQPRLTLGRGPLGQEAKVVVLEPPRS